MSQTEYCPLLWNCIQCFEKKILCLVSSQILCFPSPVKCWILNKILLSLKNASATLDIFNSCFQLWNFIPIQNFVLWRFFFLKKFSPLKTFSSLIFFYFENSLIYFDFLADFAYSRVSPKDPQTNLNGTQWNIIIVLLSQACRHAVAIRFCNFSFFSSNDTNISTQINKQVWSRQTWDASGGTAARAPLIVTAAHLRVRVCDSVFVSYSTSRHGYHVDFGWTFVNVYVFNCVIVSFLLLRVIGIGRSLFGRTFVCVCARVSACVGVCFAIARHRDSAIFFRYLLDFIHARGCVRVRVPVFVCVCINRVPGCSPIHSDIRPTKNRRFRGYLENAWRTDGRADRPSYRDAWTHLKTVDQREYLN